MPVSSKDLIELFEKAYNEKWGYIWGTAGEQWTEKKQVALEKTTDLNRASSRQYGAKWIGHRVSDCSGLFYWAFKQLGSYMYHGSDTMWDKYCMYRGKLENGLRTDGKYLKPGTAVFTGTDDNKPHVGLYVGDGKVIEASGTRVGVITSQVSNKKWKYWGELKDCVFSDAEKEVSPMPQPVQYPTLREGAKGDPVKVMQELLSKNGSSLKIDGIFGSGTRNAVKAFQKANGLTVDGICGPKTWAKLLETPTEMPEEPEELTLEQKVDILWEAYIKNKG